jgi:hypothetical protein
MDLLVLKYYVIGLFPKIKQQVKYKRLADVTTATHIIERKKKSLELTRGLSSWISYCFWNPREFWIGRAATSAKYNRNNNGSISE